jgi:H+-translocating NAD(P) transhydrogenase subunit alpha
MLLGVPKETYPGERRVALAPETAASLIGVGWDVALEAGAGGPAGLGDDVYRDKGVEIIAARAEVFSRADIVLQVRTLGANPQAGSADIDLLRQGQVLVGLAEPLSDASPASRLAAAGASLFALELIPRITRAQGMDVLSSMATLAGYRAALLAAEHLPRIFPLMMTAAGTLAPARVLVIGAGVAGLQAIATARRLGAVVSGYDVRPAVREQVESLGARFVELDIQTEDSEDAGGYAKQQSAEFYRRQQEALGEVVAAHDVVITTAAVPGKKAPLLLPTSMVEGMAAGSVIIDLAAERGGNCELTSPDQTVEHGGVRVVGPTNLPSTVAVHASQMYGHNIAAFVRHLAPEGKINLDLEDEIIRETLVTHDGQIVHPLVRQLDGGDTPAAAGEKT